MESAKKTARIAGLLYLIIAITGAFGIMYVPTQLFAGDDINLTAKNILENELLFRFGIFSNLVCQTVFVFLALTLYNLFKNVNAHLARTLVALVIVGVPIAFFIIFNEYYILLILKENFMNNFPSVQQNALAMLSLKMYGNGNVIIGIFWGLWLIPFGQLSYQSGFIPKILGVLLILGGLCYLIDTTAFILFPEYHSITGILVGITSATAESAMVGWLLIKGVKTKK
ncbi:DUF4386 domain-containing protein [Flavobacterium cupreum]|uniref:DUF4386 domain-containing protein n=1 Tax=Flavobacterium cupreum TaxID=2133766 RepID=A0A434A6R6_9FLAO|nr:DUF4386 domain-containing protein [Flavobacterium cupreum]RUT70036.1 DUF4386 domain-containing protein [Flavobacterium cupreum]